MKKTVPLLAVTALSAQLFIVGTAKAESTEAPRSPEATEVSHEFTLVSAVRSGAKTAKDLLDAVDAAGKPAPPVVVRRRASGNGKSSGFDMTPAMAMDDPSFRR